MENEEEIWKDIYGYEGLYKVSNLGNIKSLDREIYNLGTKCINNIKGKILKNHINNKGYKYIDLYRDRIRTKFYVHRLVFLTFNSLSLDFLGLKSNTVICHKDDNPINCILE